MADTTVTVDTTDEGESTTETETHQEAAHEGASAAATVEASTAAAENKAHSEHSAADAQNAADEAKDHKQMAEWSAESARAAVSEIATLASTVIAAVESIPERVAEALGGMAQTTDSDVVLTEAPETPGSPIPPATPPNTGRRKFGDWYRNASIGGK